MGSFLGYFMNKDEEVTIMADMMTFPNTVEEFMEQYKITDTEQIYTNGTELVPIFRMKQWFEHINAQSEQQWIPCSERLPEVPSTNDEIENYLVCSEDGNIIVMMWADGWNCTLFNGTVNRKYEIDDVIAWMPIPEPYKGGEP